MGRLHRVGRLNQGPRAPHNPHQRAARCRGLLGDRRAAPRRPTHRLLVAHLPVLLCLLQGRRDGSTRDEPFAWESREFLRKLCVGKVRAGQAASSSEKPTEADTQQPPA